VTSGAEALFAASLRAEPTRPLVTFYNDATGERIELSARSLANWVAKTHFLLIDELGLGVGDTALVAAPTDWITVAILLGCWSAGLSVTATAAESAAVAFVTADTVAIADSIPDVFAIDLAAMSRSSVNPPAPAADYVTAVRPQPDAWAGVRFAAGPADAAIDGITRAQLTTQVSARATELGIPAGARVLFEGGWTGAPGWIDGLLVPLSVGGSTVLVVNADSDSAKRERRIQQEQVTAVISDLHR
jgi:uncharacterized protein (TIGR03089 family)